jgi:hypothetical protein
MSRLSRANLKARESIFYGGPEQYIGDIQATCPPSLADCVAVMEDCCDEVCLIHPLVYAEGRNQFLGLRDAAFAEERNERSSSHEQNIGERKGESFSACFV